MLFGNLVLYRNNDPADTTMGIINTKTGYSVLFDHTGIILEPTTNKKTTTHAHNVEASHEIQNSV